jgi:acetyltransferase
MDFFFNPKAIAVVGATPNPFKGGCSILKNLMVGYGGRIYPINPRYEEIEGLPCYPSVSVIPDSIDLAIVFVPAKMVPPAVEDCIRKGIPGVMIESGGFAEAGQEGRILQQALIDIAKKSSIRLWGPNCMGLVDAMDKEVTNLIGIHPDDMVIISFGEDLAASTLITLHLKQLKVKNIIVKAPNEARNTN